MPYGSQALQRLQSIKKISAELGFKPPDQQTLAMTLTDDEWRQLQELATTLSLLTTQPDIRVRQFPNQKHTLYEMIMTKNFGDIWNLITCVRPATEKPHLFDLRSFG